MHHSSLIVLYQSSFTIHYNSHTDLQHFIDPFGFQPGAMHGVQEEDKEGQETDGDDNVKGI